MADDMATVEPEEVEGQFASQKKRAVKSLFGDLVASELVHFKAYGSINACQHISLIQYKEQPAGEK